MKSIFSILSQKKTESPVLRGAAAAMTVEEANKILAELFGAEIERYAQAVYIKNGTLTFECKGSAAASEIKLNENKILAKIREKFGQNSVSKIRYRA